MESDCLRRWSGTHGKCGKSPCSVLTLRRNCRCFPPVSPPPLLNFTLDISLTFYRKPDGPNSTELHRGFGYVEFEDPEDIQDAIDNMEGAELFGKVLKVSAAKAPKNVNEGLGSKTALWEQVSKLILSFWHDGLCRFDHVLTKHRRAGLQRTLLVRRTRWQQTEQRQVQMMLHMILCRAWRAWMLLDQNQHEKGFW